MLKRFIASVLFTAASLAQTSADPKPSTPIKHEQSLELWGSASMFNGTMLGATAANTKFEQVGFRYRRDLFTRRNISMRYTADVMPLTFFYDPYFVPPAKPGWIYGAGFNPLGLQFVFRRDQKVNPFFGGSAGFLFNTRPLMQSGVRYSFTADWNIGAEFRLQPRHTLSLAFHYQHLSNAELGTFNLGAEHGAVRLGYTLWQSK
jgi:hypothetical protein